MADSPVKLSIDESLRVHARYAGDDANSLVLKIRKEQSSDWMRIPMIFYNDNLWSAEHFFTELGMYRYTIETDSSYRYCYPIEIPVWIESSRIRYSSWYQRFLRSCSDTPNKHATFKEFQKELRRIADMGFDTVYIPPIHPIFRVDNPHTKPVSFWEWLLYQIKLTHPEVIFLSEALTTSNRMHQLAKIGMSQSYDYFQWKTSKAEIESYYSEIYTNGISSYFRPVLWTNILQNLPPYLQNRDKNAFLTRLILACTLGASYGIYGPPFEYCMNEPLEDGSVEYKDSEQFEIPD